MNGVELIMWARGLGPKPVEKAEKLRRQEWYADLRYRVALRGAAYEEIEESETDEIYWQALVRGGYIQ